jgi:predicted PurR-regulated permease PerM
MVQEGGDNATWRFPVTLLAAGFIVYLLRDVLVPFAMAFVLAYIFTPIVNRLERSLRLPRLIAILLLFLALAGPFVLLIVYQGPSLAQNVRNLAEKAPDHVARYIATIFGGEQIWFLGQTIDARSVAHGLILQTQDFLGTPHGMAEIGWSFVKIVVNAVFTLAVLFYFLAGGEGLIRGALRMAPAERRERIQELILKIDALIGRYLRGLAVVVVFVATVVWLTFRFVFHIPYPLLLALIIALLELIPLFGPIVSGVLTFAVALTNGDLLFTVKVVIFYLALRFTVDQAVGPIVLGKAVTLSPVVVIFAFLAGGTLFGFLGLLFAVPAAAVLRVVLNEHTAG